MGCRGWDVQFCVHSTRVLLQVSALSSFGLDFSSCEMGVRLNPQLDPHLGVWTLWWVVQGSRVLSSFHSHPEGVPEVPLTPEAVSVELRPLMLWMANTTEMLSFVQEKVLEMEKEADQEGELEPRPRPVQAPCRSPHLRTWAPPCQPLALPLTPRPILRPTALQ